MGDKFTYLRKLLWILKTQPLCTSAKSNIGDSFGRSLSLPLCQEKGNRGACALKNCVPTCDGVDLTRSFIAVVQGAGLLIRISVCRACILLIWPPVVFS